MTTRNPGLIWQRRSSTVGSCSTSCRTSSDYLGDSERRVVSAGGEKAGLPEGCVDPWTNQALLGALADPRYDPCENMRRWIGSRFALGSFEPTRDRLDDTVDGLHQLARFGIDVHIVRVAN